MQIPSYQIHNVLNVYGKQLGKEKPSIKNDKPAEGHMGERVELSLEGRRKAIADKVASDIISRITQFGPESEADQKVSDRPEGESVKTTGGYPQKDSFVFNVIDADNNKKTRELLLEKSNSLIDRLGMSVKKGV